MAMVSAASVIRITQGKISKGRVSEIQYQDELADTAAGKATAANNPSVISAHKLCLRMFIPLFQSFISLNAVSIIRHTHPCFHHLSENISVTHCHPIAPISTELHLPPSFVLFHCLQPSRNMVKWTQPIITAELQPYCVLRLLGAGPKYWNR